MPPFDRALYKLPLMFYSNYGSMSCRFWCIQSRNYRDLEISVKGQSRSLNVVPFERMGMFPY